jgi:hypothetical protein
MNNRQLGIKGSDSSPPPYYPVKNSLTAAVKILREFPTEQDDNAWLNDEHKNIITRISQNGVGRQGGFRTHIYPPKYF